MKPTIEDLMIEINNDVLMERIQQNEKWGNQRHSLGVWLAILGEEFGEVCQASQSYLNLVSAKKTDANDLYIELIQVAAVASAIAEQIKEESNQDE
jgi:NTP pyrophosphatase (non-canonical NTP hydrolase)